MKRLQSQAEARQAARLIDRFAPARFAGFLADRS
jgi:hypothetical protein